MGAEESQRGKTRASFEEWEKTTLAKTVGRFPERMDDFDTPSGLKLDRLYTPTHVAEGWDYVSQLG